MPINPFCSLVCFIVVPLLVALLAFWKRDNVVGTFCLISIFLGVGPLVALLTLFKLFDKQRLLDISLIVLGAIVLYMLLYTVRHYFYWDLHF